MFFLKAIPMNFTGPMSFAEFLDQFKLVCKEVVSLPQFQTVNIHEYCLFTSLCCCFLQKRRLLACSAFSAENMGYCGSISCIIFHELSNHS